jgi:hypothetical protein
MPQRCRLFGDRVLRLALGAHKQHNLAVGGQILHELRRLFEHLQRLLQIDDVNPVALAEDVFLHLGIPALRLMPEVNTRFEQLLHGDVSQLTSCPVADQAGAGRLDPGWFLLIHMPPGPLATWMKTLL